MKRVLITQSNYIPWKGYFDAINLADAFILYDSAQYTRRDWRNRNKIVTPSGPSWLTIPVQVRGKFYQAINEVRVSDLEWSKNHWQVIQQNYSKAPHYAAYGPIVKSLYESVCTDYLSEINYFFLSELCKILGICTKFYRINEFDLVEGKSNRLLDLCKQLDATHYLTGPSAKGYLDEELFNQNNVQVEYMSYDYKPYTQLYGSFIHEVSLIDLLFNEGDKIKEFMNSFTN